MPSEEDTDEDASPPPPHFMVLVDLRKGSGGEGYDPCSVLVDSGTTYNFISQSIADKLRLEAVKAGRKRNRKKMPLPITTVNGELLYTTVVLQQMVRMCTDARMKRSHAINFVTDIAHYNIILGMAWLQKQNPNNHWDIGAWH